MPITKIRKEPKVSASNVNVSPGQQLDDALTAIGAALDAKANAADVAAVTGQRSNLNTTDKSNLVAAINEVKGNIPTSYDELTDKPIVKTSGNGFVIVAQGTNRANMATAQNAFAEGNGTYAAGIASHTEGSDTYADADNAHAEGNGKVVIMLEQAYTQGDLTIVTDVPYPVGTELESPRTQERATVVSVQESQGVYICTLAQAFSENIATNQPLNVYGGALGENSHAEGCGTVAASASTHAEGYGTIASGFYAKASGEKSYALGRASEATCKGTQALNEAEFATGAYNKSTSGSTRFSVGIGADAQHRKNAYEITQDGKIYVFGLGNYDGTNASVTGTLDLATIIAQGGGGGTYDYNDLENVPILNTEGGGYKTPDATSAGNACFAEGRETEARGGYSHAEGYGSIASSQAHAEGYFTKAEGLNSHAEGDHSQAKSGNTHAEGYYTIASTQYSHAEGFSSETHGSAAHAEGNNTRANGDASHAEGSNSSAGADFSHAEGHYTKALGECSHAEGWNTFTRNKGEHACGRYNSSTTDVTLFSIGCGDEGQYGASSTHQNAFEVDVNGNIYIKGIGNYKGMNIGQSGVESVQEVIARLERALGGNNS